MKNNSVVYLFASLFINYLAISCGETNNQADVKMSSQVQTSSPILKDLNVTEFKTKIDENKGIILDVRTPEEYKQGHIKNATTINFYDDNFKDQVEKLPKNKPILVYCKGGNRSAKAANILKYLGYSEIYNLKGGITAWKSNHYKVTTE
jgi:rhodanese-related sulfurtransferase